MNSLLGPAHILVAIHIIITILTRGTSRAGKGETWTNRTARNQSSARNHSMPTVEQGLSYLGTGTLPRSPLPATLQGPRSPHY